MHTRTQKHTFTRIQTCIFARTQRIAKTHTLTLTTTVKMGERSKILNWDSTSKRIVLNFSSVICQLNYSSESYVLKQVLKGTNGNLFNLSPPKKIIWSNFSDKIFLGSYVIQSNSLLSHICVLWGTDTRIWFWMTFVYVKYPWLNEDGYPAKSNKNFAMLCIFSPDSWITLQDDCSKSNSFATGRTILRESCKMKIRLQNW